MKLNVTCPLSVGYIFQNHFITFHEETHFLFVEFEYVFCLKIFFFCNKVLNIKCGINPHVECFKLLYMMGGWKNQFVIEFVFGIIRLTLMKLLIALDSKSATKFYNTIWFNLLCTAAICFQKTILNIFCQIVVVFVVLLEVPAVFDSISFVETLVVSEGTRISFFMPFLFYFFLLGNFFLTDFAQFGLK